MCSQPPLTRVPGRRPPTGILTTSHASLSTAGVSRHSNRSAAGPQRAASAKPGVIKRQRQVTTRGGITSADLPGLFLLAVSRALPVRRGSGPVSKGTVRTLGGLSRQDRRPGEGLRSRQPQHHAQACGRGYESGDVVGLYRSSGLLLEIYAACLSSKPLSSQ
jgi:hypothetical protein